MPTAFAAYIHIYHRPCLTAPWVRNVASTHSTATLWSTVRHASNNLPTIYPSSIMGYLGGCIATKTSRILNHGRMRLDWSQRDNLSILSKLLSLLFGCGIVNSACVPVPAAEGSYDAAARAGGCASGRGKAGGRPPLHVESHPAIHFAVARRPK